MLKQSHSGGDNITPKKSAAAFPTLNTLTSNYSIRSNAGQCIVNYNPAQLLAPSTSDDKNSYCDCVLRKLDDVGVKERYHFMMSTPQDHSRYLESSLLSIQEELTKEKDIKELAPVGAPMQSEVTVIGRIIKDRESSILLEGSYRDNGGARIFLSINDPVHVFPGQVVAVRGINSGGGKMTVRELFSGTSPAPRKSSAFHRDSPLSIMVAAGPYTTMDNLDYKPFSDLLLKIRSSRPHVAILLGPFIDISHPIIASGNAALPGADGNVEEPVDAETLFRLKISEMIATLLVDSNFPTKFVLIPSIQDAFHDFTYPQPPLQDRISGGVVFGAGEFGDDMVYTLGIPDDPRIMCLPNPAAFEINGVLFATTSLDVLFDLSTEGAFLGPLGGGGRMVRLTEQLLAQQSFYPLNPPRLGIPIDYRQISKIRMPSERPDVLILPSRLTQFVHNVRGCVCINPGYLSRGSGGGTYSTIYIHTDNPTVMEGNNGVDSNIAYSIAERTIVEVCRI